MNDCNCQRCRAELVCVFVSFFCQRRLFDHSMEGFKNWEFMTTHCWGEKAAGDWVLEIYDSPSQLRSQKVPGRMTRSRSSVHSFGISGTQSFVMSQRASPVAGSTYSSTQSAKIASNIQLGAWGRILLIV